MKDKLKNLGNLPLQYRILLVFGFLAILFGGFWQFVYSDLNVKRAELKESVRTTEDKIIQQRKIARNLKRYTEEVKGLDEQLGTVLRELPDQKEIEGFLRSISLLAVDTGLEVLEFTPEGENPEDFFASLPVQMKLEGTYHQLITFFDEVANLPRIVNIDNISVKILNETSEEVIVRVSCRATTYRYLEESERVTDEEDDGGKNKRRRRTR